jgi:hypothetical protein
MGEKMVNNDLLRDKQRIFTGERVRWPEFSGCAVARRLSRD